MNKSALSAVIPAALLAFSLFLTGCNSGSGGNSSEPRDSNNDTVAEGVVGPLDVIQGPLNDQVINQLALVLGGTPLEGTIDCVGQAVVLDVIDVLDAVALAVQDAAAGQDTAAAFDAASENIQFAVNELVNDLPGALTALVGEDCNTAAGTGFSFGDNPLEGTPLEPLGASLIPVFQAISSEPGEDVDLQTLSELVHQLSEAFGRGTAQIPDEARDAPIVGGLLTTLEVALQDLDNTLDPLGQYQGEDAAEELEVTLNHLLKNVLTELVPISFIEAQAGQEGIISGPISGGVDTLTDGIKSNLLDAALPPLSDALDGPLAVLLDPIENNLLPAILGPIGDALMDGSVDGPTGTSLDQILAQVFNALSIGADSTPLGPILTPLLGSLGTGGDCPLGGTPLSAICDLLI